MIICVKNNEAITDFKYSSIALGVNSKYAKGKVNKIVENKAGKILLILLK